jgi:hypothetical protein
MDAQRERRAGQGRAHRGRHGRDPERVELVPEPRRARLVRGILERQMVMIARISHLEARLDRLDPEPKRKVP